MAEPETIKKEDVVRVVDPRKALGNSILQQTLQKKMEEIWATARLVYDEHHHLEKVFNHIRDYQGQTKGIWNKILAKPLDLPRFLSFVDVVLNPLHHEKDLSHLNDVLEKEAPATRKLLEQVNTYRNKYEALKRLEAWRAQMEAWDKDKQWDHALSYTEANLPQMGVLLSPEGTSSRVEVIEQIREQIQKLSATGSQLLEQMLTFIRSFQIKPTNSSAFNQYLEQITKNLKDRRLVSEKELQRWEPLTANFNEIEKASRFLTIKDKEMIDLTGMRDPEQLEPAFALEKLVRVEDEINEQIELHEDKKVKEQLHRLSKHLPDENWKKMLATNHQVLTIMDQAHAAASLALNKERARWEDFREFVEKKRIFAVQHLDPEAFKRFKSHFKTDIAKDEDPKNWVKATTDIINRREPRKISYQTYLMIHQVIYRGRKVFFKEMREQQKLMQETFATFLGKKGSRRQVIKDIIKILEKEKKMRSKSLSEEIKPLYKDAKKEIDDKVEMMLDIRKMLLQLRYQNMSIAPSLKDYLDRATDFNAGPLREKYFKTMTELLPKLKEADNHARQAKQLSLQNLRANGTAITSLFTTSRAYVELYLKGIEQTDLYDRITIDAEEDPTHREQMKEGIKRAQIIIDTYRYLATRMGSLREYRDSSQLLSIHEELLSIVKEKPYDRSLPENVSKVQS